MRQGRKRKEQTAQAAGNIVQKSPHRHVPALFAPPGMDRENPGAARQKGEGPVFCKQVKTDMRFEIFGTLN
jgi:hypothetical protein